MCGAQRLMHESKATVDKLNPPPLLPPATAMCSGSTSFREHKKSTARTQSKYAPR